MVSRSLRELTDGTSDIEKNDIGDLAKTYNSFIDGSLEDISGFCSVVDIEEIRKQDYILTPGRYVGVPEKKKMMNHLMRKWKN